MPNPKTQTEKSAADKTSLGFDYQYYFFLWKLLLLKPGETVGLEVKDDVHTELNNNLQVLYQIKHTIKTKSDGTPANMASLDSDLWKTLSNWALVIKDPSAGRVSQESQANFIKKTEFVLSSNKSSNSGNSFISAIDKFKKGDLNVEEACQEINKLKSITTDVKIKEYIENVNSLPKPILSSFLAHLYFDLDQNDIIERCRDAIKASKIAEKRIDQVFASVDSAIRKDNFFLVRDGLKIQISFEDFYSKYRRHFDIARNEGLIIEKFSGEMPERLEEQTFIRQLIEIGDLESFDLELIAEFSRLRLMLVNNLNSWQALGEVTQDEIEDLFCNAKIEWLNEFRKNYRKVSENIDLDALAQNIVDSVRENRLSIVGQQLEIGISNGCYYELSNKPVIGWRKDWEKYKK